MHTQIQAPATRALRAGEKLATAMYAGEMPRERLARLGPQGLKDEELLAVALGTGYKGRHVRELATEILADAVVETLIDMELDQLSRIKGVGQGQGGCAGRRLRIGAPWPAQGPGRAAGGSLSRRRIAAARRYPGPAARALPLPLPQCPQPGHPQGSGFDWQPGLSSSIVHPREVFQPAVAQSAASVVLAHNHPSGDVLPSQDDIELTRRLVQAGEIMGIDVLDPSSSAPTTFSASRSGG